MVDPRKSRGGGRAEGPFKGGVPANKMPSDKKSPTSPRSSAGPWYQRGGYDPLPLSVSSCLPAAARSATEPTTTETYSPRRNRCVSTLATNVQTFTHSAHHSYSQDSKFTPPGHAVCWNFREVIFFWLYKMSYPSCTFSGAPFWVVCSPATAHSGNIQFLIPVAPFILVLSWNTTVLRSFFFFILEWE